MTPLPALSVAPPPAGQLPLLDADRHLRPFEELEAEIIRFAIAHYRGHMSEVARRLRIGRSTLYRKLEGLQSEGTLPAEAAPALADPVAAG
jgi:DNA-binding NtrC family response regulator